MITLSTSEVKLVNRLIHQDILSHLQLQTGATLDEGLQYWCGEGSEKGIWRSLGPVTIGTPDRGQ